MSAAIKQFSALKAMRKNLQTQAQASAKAERERVRQAKQDAEDQNLFRSSIGQVVVLNTERTYTAPRLPPTRPQLNDASADALTVLQLSLSDEFSYDNPLDADATLSFVRNGVSHDTLQRLHSGHWAVQRQLDLHGLRTDPARTALVAFLRDAQQHGLRCVLIVHGKGFGSTNGEPVLKNKVRNWLMQKEEVLAFCSAAARQGGSGALIVLLKAPQRLPAAFE